ncbi:aminopeptidase P family protein [Salipaludibacillus agaradhaerens]|uniref:Aminopeptidase P family protein n=1 Tax=Salipaludibacillus agaradhaerens TaxID=76935 RepID=A0A9Q4B1M3_SALAG|nr:Xaa-Pro peptidase family protein [Salipaludibacillus agaradhaerens]MCR6096681.1 aminopeptidase P family protein [Salipaludibacillus agaradhaerens]MCR6113760.1 aminopeptidase P family protein [Salipaludibacillus agaradhaerens]
MDRLNGLRQQFKENGIDGILITNPYNRRYLTGFTGTAGVVVVSDEKAKLITDFRYIDQAQEEVVEFEVIQHNRALHEEVANQVKEMGITRLGFEKNVMTYSHYDTYKATINCELIPVSELVENLRLIKSNEEVVIIQEAVDIADAAFSHIQSYLRPGVKEIDISNELEFFMRKNGAVSSSFDIIVASGYRSALPHGVASDKVIEKGELVTLDFGAYYKGYCSDITRTVAIGEPSSQLREIYETVLQAQLIGVNHIKAGLTGKEADALTRNYINEKGYGQYFGHSTGHGLGMEVHEAPGLSHRSDKRLKAGMVVTVEPGIYMTGIGGTRIEDDILITDNGNNILSKSSKELLILGE